MSEGAAVAGIITSNVEEAKAVRSAEPAVREVPIPWSARDLIRRAKENPPRPIIQGLLCEGDTLLIHGTEESYKSVFVLQVAEGIALERPLLRLWDARRARRVGVIETEMHTTMLGERLAKMFPERDAPENILFLPEETLKRWRGLDMGGKFRLIGEWVHEEGIQVLMVDTANDFFRGQDNPSEERHVGTFFDHLRNLQVQARIIVRHDRKKKDVDIEAHSNELIRGSAEWKEDPEAILYIKRADKRTHKVWMELGKLRYGVKPEPLTLWFDAGCFRLVPLPPVIALLEAGSKTRQELLDECSERFGVEQRAMDAMLAEHRDLLREDRQGHNSVFGIDLERAREANPNWFSFLLPHGRLAAREQ